MRATSLSGCGAWMPDRPDLLITWARTPCGHISSRRVIRAKPSRAWYGRDRDRRQLRHKHDQLGTGQEELGPRASAPRGCIPDSARPYERRGIPAASNSRKLRRRKCDYRNVRIAAIDDIEIAEVEAGRATMTMPRESNAVGSNRSKTVKFHRGVTCHVGAG
jgi:hypothetical protein